jgi:hydrogenase maturation protease
MSAARILVAGIGNIFLGDDAFGVAVAQRLMRQAVPAEVRVVDFGIRGLDLAYALQERYELAILVDVIQRGGAPGTLYVLEPDLSGQPAEQPGETDDAAWSPHGLTPASVLGLVKSLGGSLPALRIVGCEPATFGSDEEPAMDLSPAVQAAVEEAARMVEQLWTEALGRTPSPAPA